MSSERHTMLTLIGHQATAVTSESIRCEVWLGPRSFWLVQPPAVSASVVALCGDGGGSSGFGWDFGPDGFGCGFGPVGFGCGFGPVGFCMVGFDPVCFGCGFGPVGFGCGLWRQSGSCARSPAPASSRWDAFRLRLSLTDRPAAAGQVGKGNPSRMLGPQRLPSSPRAGQRDGGQCTVRPWARRHQL